MSELSDTQELDWNLACETATEITMLFQDLEVHSQVEHTLQGNRDMICETLRLGFP